MAGGNTEDELLIWFRQFLNEVRQIRRKRTSSRGFTSNPASQVGGIVQTSVTSPQLRAPSQRGSSSQETHLTFTSSASNVNSNNTLVGSSGKGSGLVGGHSPLQHEVAAQQPVLASSGKRVPTVALISPTSASPPLPSTGSHQPSNGVASSAASAAASPFSSPSQTHLSLSLRTAIRQQEDLLDATGGFHPTAIGEALQALHIESSTTIVNTYDGSSSKGFGGSKLGLPLFPPTDIGETDETTTAARSTATSGNANTLKNMTGTLQPEPEGYTAETALASLLPAIGGSGLTSSQNLVMMDRDKQKRSRPNYFGNSTGHRHSSQSPTNTPPLSPPSATTSNHQSADRPAITVNTSSTNNMFRTVSLGTSLLDPIRSTFASAANLKGDTSQQSKLSKAIRELPREQIDYHLDKAVRLIFQLIKETAKSGTKSLAVSRQNSFNSKPGRSGEATPTSAQILPSGKDFTFPPRRGSDAESRSGTPTTLRADRLASAEHHKNRTSVVSVSSDGRAGHSSKSASLHQGSKRLNSGASTGNHSPQTPALLRRPLAKRTSIATTDSSNSDNDTSNNNSPFHGSKLAHDLPVFTLTDDVNSPGVVITDSLDIDDLMGSQSLNLDHNFTESTNLRQETDNDGNRIINDHVVVRHLGKGQYGTVKLAHPVGDPGNLLAIKIIGRSLGRGKSQSHEEALKKEIAVMKKLRHQNIVTLRQVVNDPEADKLYLIMDFVGEDHLLKKESDPSRRAEGYLYEPIPESLAVLYTRQLVDGLRYLHKHNIVHRDIKPENIMRKGNHVYITDFGVSEIVDLPPETDDVEGLEENSPLGNSHSSRRPSTNASPLGLSASSPSGGAQRRRSSTFASNTFAAFGSQPFGASNSTAIGVSDRPLIVNGQKGTPTFWPPEMFEIVEANDFDGEVHDLWSLGVTIYMMLTGKAPFPARNLYCLRAKMTSEDLQVDIPEHLSLNARFLLSAMLSKDQMQRLTLLDVRHHPFMGGVDKRSARARGSVMVITDEHDEETAFATAGSPIPPVWFLVGKVKPVLLAMLRRARHRIATGTRLEKRTPRRRKTLDALPGAMPPCPKDSKFLRVDCVHGTTLKIPGDMSPSRSASPNYISTAPPEAPSTRRPSAHDGTQQSPRGEGFGSGYFSRAQSKTTATSNVPSSTSSAAAPIPRTTSDMIPRQPTTNRNLAIPSIDEACNLAAADTATVRPPLPRTHSESSTSKGTPPLGAQVATSTSSTAPTDEDFGQPMATQHTLDENSSNEDDGPDCRNEPPEVDTSLPASVTPVPPSSKPEDSAVRATSSAPHRGSNAAMSSSAINRHSSYTLNSGRRDGAQSVGLHPPGKKAAGIYAITGIQHLREDSAEGGHKEMAFGPRSEGSPLILKPTLSKLQSSASKGSFGFGFRSGSSGRLGLGVLSGPGSPYAATNVYSPSGGSSSGTMLATESSGSITDARGPTSSHPLPQHPSPPMHASASSPHRSLNGTNYSYGAPMVPSPLSPDELGSPMNHQHPPNTVSNNKTIAFTAPRPLRAIPALPAHAEQQPMPLGFNIKNFSAVLSPMAVTLPYGSPMASAPTSATALAHPVTSTNPAKVEAGVLPSPRIGSVHRGSAALSESLPPVTGSRSPRNPSSSNSMIQNTYPAWAGGEGSTSGYAAPPSPSQSHDSRVRSKLVKAIESSPIDD